MLEGAKLIGAGAATIALAGAAVGIGNVFSSLIQLVARNTSLRAIFPYDAAEPWQLGFQDAATPMMQGIKDLHHDIFFFLILILIFVLVCFFIIIHKMEGEGAGRITTSSSSHSNDSSDDKNKEIRKIRRLAVVEIEKCKDRFKNEIVSTFPQMEAVLFTPEFLTYLVDSFLEDAGLSSDLFDFSLSDLKQVNSNLKSAVKRIELEGFANNDLYSAIKNFVRKKP